MPAHTRNLIIAYAVAAVALLITYLLTMEWVVLVVLAGLVVIGVGHVLLSRTGSVADMAHHQARHESIAREGTQPPERPRGM